MKGKSAKRGKRQETGNGQKSNDAPRCPLGRWDRGREKERGDLGEMIGGAKSTVWKTNR